MGFQETLANIIDVLSDNRQTMLFSATYPEQIKKIADNIMRQPKMIKVAPTQDTVRVDQRFYQVHDDAHRLEALKLLLLDHSATSTVVFCNTRKDTQAVAGALKSAGFSAAALHGDMEQKDRDQTLIRFANKSLCILVATDVAARGLDCLLYTSPSPRDRG